MKSSFSTSSLAIRQALAAGVLALAALASPVRATLISIDRLVAGDGQLTRDTASGLDWLDLTLTQNQSQASATGLTGVGGPFEGFRLATVAEFQTLVTSAGLVYGPSTAPTQIAAAYGLQNLLGVTVSFSDSSGVFTNSLGWLFGSVSGNANNGFVQINDYTPQQGTDIAIAANGGGTGNASANFGLFLVRNSPPPDNSSSVPDAGSGIGLLATSLLGLLALRRTFSSTSTDGALM